LAAGETVTCTSVVSAEGDQRANTATATALLPGGSMVSATDTSYYYGIPLTIRKSTNGADANTPPGLSLPAGSAVNWTYEVTNLGSETLTGVAVTDDQGVTVTCPSDTLAAASTMTCTAADIAIAGQYANIGTATATSSSGTITASDPSHYFGQALPLDFGDAPASYPTLFANDGARHVTGAPVFLGACVDAETDAFASAAADGDDTNAGAPVAGSCAAAGDDEDGVAFPAPLYIGQTASVDVVASAPCTLSAWIDFNADGDWSDPGETLFAGGTAIPAGSSSPSFPIPSGATAGQTFARFRCSTDGATNVTGQASDGEVEDYQVLLVTPLPSIAATKTDALLLDADNDGLAEPGDTLRYTVVISNTGPGAGSPVAFNDTPGANTTLIAGSVTTSSGTVTTGNGGGDTAVAVNAGNVPASGSVTITFDVTIATPVPPGVTSVSNQGTVSGGNFTSIPTDDPAAGGAADPTVTTLTITPIVTATKTDALLVDADGDGLAEPGDTLRYTIAIANGGNGAATAVTFSDTPDPNTALVAGSVTTTTGSVTTGNGGGDTTVAVNAGTIPAAASVTIAFDVTIDTPIPAGVTSVSNQGTVSGSNFTSLPTDDPAAGGAADPTVTTLTLTPAVTAMKTDALLLDGDSDGLAEPGDTIRYTIVIANGGNGAATAVTLSDTPDANTALVAGSVTTTAGTVTSGNTPGDPSVAVNAGTLAGGGASVTIRFDVTIDDPLPPSATTISNQGTVSGGNIPSIATDDPAAPSAADPTVTPVVLMPLVTAAKTAALQVDADGNGSPSPGDTLRYTITLTNNGTGDATGVQLSDTPDPNTALVPGSVTTTAGAVTSGNAPGQTTVEVAIGTLPGQGGTATVHFDVTIDNPFPPGVTRVENTATFSGANIPGGTSDDPSLGGGNDATMTAIVPATIPTLSTWALLALVAFVGLVAMRRL
ncbi:MAG TPA: IPTL-CTERM sorting domain-containing protein, partial [Thermoanaerobaculia bacterium]|nr:IPTL-CTERM sorting domain-containing protein [Thermoanaerobaculia bacterium]